MAVKITDAPGFVLAGKWFTVKGTSDSGGVQIMRKMDGDDEGIGYADVSGGTWSTKKCILVDSGYPAKIYAVEFHPAGEGGSAKSSEQDVYTVGQYELIVLCIVIGIVIQKKKKIWKG